MGRLHQIIAVEKGVKSKTDKAVTDAYHLAQKPELFTGLTRTYEAAVDGDERKPPESKKIQHTATEIVAAVRAAMAELMDVTATKDASNATAKASVFVGGTALLADVPVTSLLFLEKRLTDLRTFVSKMPTLDPAESWTMDPAQGYYITPETETASIRKVNKPLVAVAATDKHPAQVAMVSEDVVAGYWRQRKSSAAMPVPEQASTLARIDTLIRAVKIAREEANSVEIVERKIGDKVLDFIFA